MANSLPAFYVDNVNLLYESGTAPDGSPITISYIRGNTVSDLQGSSSVKAYNINNCNDTRLKNNKALRIRSSASNAIGFYMNNCDTAVLVFNTASRTNNGFSFNSINDLDVYNLTSHDCNTNIITDSSGVFRNIALSSYEGHITYKNCTGFSILGGSTVNLDYTIYFNLENLSLGGTLVEGSNISENEILYTDEENDDLTPDHISLLVNSGTTNPIGTTNPDIGGIESEITDEITANRKYQYSLLDNSFWDIDNQKSGEMSIIKAAQSRIFANSELAIKDVERNIYIKQMNSSLRFSELYPMNARYQSPTKFKKNVSDMWYAGQNVGTLVAYNNAIGGYNLFPSFFKRLEDEEDCWVIDESYVDIDNYLLGMDAQKYGIVIDVLGLSTLSQAASGECYNNVMKSVADIAPIQWHLHNEPQPTNYVLFTDLYNGFENCTLTNMIYNDDFNISPDEALIDCEAITPMISTTTISASGNIAEISLLDRVYSENITRRIYYRMGNASGSSDSWTEIIIPIGGAITLTSSHIQFKITVEDILRIGDYEFLGICLRPYYRNRTFIES